MPPVVIYQKPKVCEGWGHNSQKFLPSRLKVQSFILYRSEFPNMASKNVVDGQNTRSDRTKNENETWGGNNVLLWRTERKKRQGPHGPIFSGPIWFPFGTHFIWAHLRLFGACFIYLGPIWILFGDHVYLGPYGPYSGPRCYPLLGGLLVRTNNHCHRLLSKGPPNEH